MLPINAISIENFKSFGPKQRIPLARINFLFGPNSQGKTASLIALGLLMNGYLKRKTDLKKITHLDNSPEIEIGFQNVNKNSNKDHFVLESESKQRIVNFNGKNIDVQQKEYILKKRFTIEENTTRELVKFQLFEVVHGLESLVFEMDSEFVRINTESLYLRDQLELTIDEKLPETWSSIVRIENNNISVDLGNLRVKENIKRTKGGLIDPAHILKNDGRLARAIINDILDALFVQFDHIYARSPVNNPLDWIGPNRFVSNKSCSVNREKDFIVDNFLNSSSVNEMNQWLRNNDLININYDLILKEHHKSEITPNFTLKEFGVQRIGEKECQKISEVGSGISHIYQMLLPFFNNVEFLIIQQPEIHLHPSLQVQLCRSLIHLSKEKNVQLIFETHSEHFIKAAQLEIARGAHQKEPALTYEDFSVLYISKNEDGFSTVKQMEIDESGAFREPWPDDFFELSADLSLERLRQSYKSKN